MEDDKRYGRRWVIVIILIIVILPLITVFFLKEGFAIRDSAGASKFLFADTALQIPDYVFVSQRGDTISKTRMLDKVCVLDFTSYGCGKKIDAKDSLLFQIQEDYYGKTKGFRILSITLTPEQDKTEQLAFMSDRYQAREIWHFLRSDDSTSVKFEKFCLKASNNSQDADLFCPRFVYLVDGYGNVRGAYDPLITEQYDALYGDILFLINRLYVEEKD